MMEARTPYVEPNGGNKERFFRRRIARPIAELLRQGVTPEKMALSLAIGVALGVFPVLGTTTALCVLAGLILRLNLPAIQVVNYFVYPLQIVLLIPFFRAGEQLFGAPHLQLSVTQILAMVRTSFWSATRFLWTMVWHAAVVWCLVAPVFVTLAYVTLCRFSGTLWEAHLEKGRQTEVCPTHQQNLLLPATECRGLLRSA